MKKTLSLLIIFSFMLTLLPLRAACVCKAGENCDFSSFYMKSPYYTRLIKVVLTDDMRTNLVNVAKSQLGYHEGDSISQLTGKNSSGSGNYSEAGYWFGTKVLDWGEGYFDAWCAMFVSWCARQADIPESIISNAVRAKADSSSESGGWYNFHVDRQSADSYTPLPGDLIFFCWTGNDASWDHVGIVWYTTADSVVTIEGNQSNGVVTNTYPKNSPYIICYGVPAYTEYKGQALGYERWRVNAESGVSIRSGAGDSYEKIGGVADYIEIKITEKTTVSGAVWGRVEYGGLSGWCCLGYCKYLGGKLMAECIADALTLDTDAYGDGGNLILPTASKTVSEVLREEAEIIAYRDGEEYDSGYLATGDTLSLNGGALSSIKVVVRGDVKPDGVCGTDDYIALRLYLLGINHLEGERLSATDFNADGNINTTDYIALRLRILGIG